jgi:hypothetical protein
LAIGLRPAGSREEVGWLVWVGYSGGAAARARAYITAAGGERERKGGGPGLRREPGVLVRSLSRHRGGGESGCAMPRDSPRTGPESPRP